MLNFLNDAVMTAIYWLAGAGAVALALIAYHYRTQIEAYIASLKAPHITILADHANAVAAAAASAPPAKAPAAPIVSLFALPSLTVLGGLFGVFANIGGVTNGALALVGTIISSLNNPIVAIAIGAALGAGAVEWKWHDVWDAERAALVKEANKGADAAIKARTAAIVDQANKGADAAIKKARDDAISAANAAATAAVTKAKADAKAASDAAVAKIKAAYDAKADALPQCVRVSKK